MEGLDVLKLAIDGGKTDVGHVVDVHQLLHHVLADLVGGHLALQAVLDLGLDIVHRLLQAIQGDRTLLAGAQQAAEHLVPIEGLAGLILLHHHDGEILHHLIGGKALAATNTLAATADTAILVGRTGIDHAAVGLSAKGAFHNGVPPHRNCG